VSGAVWSLRTGTRAARRGWLIAASATPARDDTIAAPVSAAKTRRRMMPFRVRFMYPGWITKAARLRREVRDIKWLSTHLDKFH